MNKYIVTLAAMGYPRWRDVQDALDVNECDPESDATYQVIKGYSCENFSELKEILNPYGLTKTTILYAPSIQQSPKMH